jgi:hypothetical protein
MIKKLVEDLRNNKELRERYEKAIGQAFDPKNQEMVKQAKDLAEKILKENPELSKSKGPQGDNGKELMEKFLKEKTQSETNPDPLANQGSTIKFPNENPLDKDKSAPPVPDSKPPAEVSRPPDHSDTWLSKLTDKNGAAWNGFLESAMKSIDVEALLGRLGKSDDPNNPSWLTKQLTAEGSPIQRLVQNLNWEKLASKQDWLNDVHWPSFSLGQTGDGLDDSDSSSSSNVGLFVFLGIFLAVAAIVTILKVVAWYMEQAREFADKERKLGPWPVTPDNISTFDQFLRAFEYLSLLRLGWRARAWNHKEIEKQLSGGKQSKQNEAAHRLAGLYEQIRYDPLRANPDVEHLSSAKKDLILLAGAR